MIIHLGTRIESVFGRVDADGNLTEQYAVSANGGKPVRVFSAEAFAAAFAEIAEARGKLEAQGEGEPCPPPSV